MTMFRAYHLAFAAAVAIAYFTAEELGIVHAWMGYLIAALFALRLTLGLSRTSGFSFARLRPSLRPAHLRKTGLGHPAIASALTLALLLSITTTAATGIAMDQGGTLLGKSIRAGEKEHDEAAEHRTERREASLSLVPTALADDGEGGGPEEKEEGVLGELHETTGNLILPLAALHVIYLLLFRLQLARFVAFWPTRTASP